MNASKKQLVKTIALAIGLVLVSTSVYAGKAVPFARRAAPLNRHSVIQISPQPEPPSIRMVLPTRYEATDTHSVSSSSMQLSVGANQIGRK